MYEAGDALALVSMHASPTEGRATETLHDGQDEAALRNAVARIGARAGACDTMLAIKLSHYFISSVKGDPYRMALYRTCDWCSRILELNSTRSNRGSRALPPCSSGKT